LSLLSEPDDLSCKCLPASRLNPVFRIGKRNFVMDTALIACAPVAQPGEVVASLADRNAEILGALERSSHASVASKRCAGATRMPSGVW
jgi:hypothetical protein